MNADRWLCVTVKNLMRKEALRMTGADDQTGGAAEVMRDHEMSEENTSEENTSEEDITVHIAALKSEHLGERINAATALGKRKDTQTVLALIEALQDGTCFAYRAADALGAIGDSQALPALIEVFKAEESDLILRYAAADALAMIGDLEVVPSLIEALEDCRTNRAAVKALAKIGLPAVPALIDCLKEDTSPYESFSYHSAHVAIEMECADGRWATNEPVAKTGTPAIPALIEASWYKYKYRLPRFEVMDLIVRIGSPQAIPALIQALEDKHEDKTVAYGVVQALSKMADDHPNLALRSALPVLRRLRDRDPAYREVEERIEARTAAFKNLPMPAVAPPPDAQTLPRSAAAPLGDLVMPPQGFWTRLRRRLKGF